ncbi:MAG: hypothetical protein H0T89_26015 [Deltaproteobacteria bacterium]|nr:hypothetical protein [Deltaproteobacteria bacterium]MDQ3297619.1 hypothetical protein [Myxococcota bacterium]
MPDAGPPTRDSDRRITPAANRVDPGPPRRDSGSRLSGPPSESASQPGVPRRDSANRITPVSSAVRVPVSAPASAPIPQAPTPPPVPVAIRLLQGLPWLLVVLPALYQLGLLATAISGRVTYPYDLEWMEGGMLHHALRIHNGEGIYVPPSIDFIPYLYTPLYPSLLALLGSGFGLTYTLGRVISIIGLLGIALISVTKLAGRRHQHRARGPVFAGAVLGLGLFAATYPYLEGWFDLVRADTFFLFMVTAGIAGLPRWASRGTGLAGHARVAAGAALLALAFFCKQTGIIYVGLGGAIVLVVAWRRVPIYVATAGVIGLGGTWLLEHTTQGWFWTYVSKIHRAHDFNMDRFWKSFENILLHFPAMTVVIGIALVTVLATWRSRRALPPQVRPFLLWTATFAVSTVIGAIGWGTEFAHFNAYMPAFLHGALAAGAAIPAVYACWRLEHEHHAHPHAIASGASLALAIALAVTCWNARWEPRRFMPSAADVAAGDRLIARIRSIEGEVWMPSHPWYLKLAGKTPHVHRMGIKDVTTRQTRVVEGLDAAIAGRAFAAIVLDERDVHLEVYSVPRHYRAALKLPKSERPRLYTGAKVTPESIWVPATTATPPAGTTVISDFEMTVWGAWTRSGTAWGNGPVPGSLPGQGLVLGASGARFATSMHDGDAATGRVTSPPFPLDGSRLTLRLGGGTDATKLRVELWVATEIVATTSVPEPGGDTLREVTLAIPVEHRGKPGKLVLVDDAPAGHLDVDDAWLWP